MLTMYFHSSCGNLTQKFTRIKTLKTSLKLLQNNRIKSSHTQNSITGPQSRQILTILVVISILFAGFTILTPAATADAPSVTSGPTHNSALANGSNTGLNQKIVIGERWSSDDLEQTSDDVDIVMSVGNYPSEVTPTETFTVPVTVENQGSETSEEIDLGIDTIDGLSVEEWAGSVGPLDPGEQASAEWVFRLDSEDGGYADTVAIAGESPYPSAQIEVDSNEEEPEDPFFLVDVTSSNIIIEEGEEFEVSVEVENTGGQSDTQTVEIDTNGLGTATEEVSLDAGDSTTITKTFSTSSGDVGEYNGDVESEDDSTGFSVVVEEADPAVFEVESLEPRYFEVTQGNEFAVSATIRNTGGQEATKTVDYDTTMSGVEVQEEEISLAPNEEATIDFDSVDTSDADDGEHLHGVFTPDDQMEGEIRVEEADPAVFEVESFEPRDFEVTQGDEFAVSATIRNTGGQEATKTVDYATTIQSVDTREEEITLAPGEETTIDFDSIDTSDAETGEQRHGVFTPDDQMEGEIRVEEADPAVFEVESFEPRDFEVTQGDEFAVSATIRNTGGQEATKTVDYATGMSDIDSQEEEISLAPGEETTINFDPIDTSDVDDIEQDGDDIEPHGVFTPDDEMEGEIRIKKAFVPTISKIVRPQSGYESDKEYTFVVKYNQKTSTSVTADMIVDGREVASKSVDQSDSDVSFSHSFKPGKHTIQVSLENQAGEVSDEFIIDVSGQGPIIESHAPDQLRQSKDTGDKMEFSVEYSHTEAEQVDIIWTINGETIARDQRTVSHEFTDSGTKTIQAVVRDAEGREDSRTWKVSADNFQVSPRIADQTTSETISLDGSREILTLSVNHPAQNERSVIFELRAEIPNGFTIVGIGDVNEADRAQASISQSLEPGQTQDMSIELQVQDNSLVGKENSLEYELIYKPTDAPNEAVSLENNSIQFTVVDDNSSSNEETSDNDSEDLINDSIPGFGFVPSLGALLAVVLLFRRIE